MHILKMYFLKNESRNWCITIVKIIVKIESSGMEFHTKITMSGDKGVLLAEPPVDCSQELL
jgi:hypothetical protein